VMTTGDPDPTLARDTMFAVVMIVLNGLVGLALLLGGMRYKEQEYNLREAESDLAILESCLLRLSALVGAYEEIQEIDINPMFVAPKRGKSLIVDARVRVGSVPK